MSRLYNSAAQHTMTAAVSTAVVDGLMEKWANSNFEDGFCMQDLFAASSDDEAESKEGSQLQSLADSADELAAPAPCSEASPYIVFQFGQDRITLPAHAGATSLAFKIWRSALISATRLSRQQTLLDGSSEAVAQAASLSAQLLNRSCVGKEVLELGCGCGLVGLLAGKLGAKRVVMTDCNDAALLELRNLVEHPLMTSHCSSSHPATSQLPGSCQATPPCCSYEVRHLLWQQDKLAWDHVGMPPQMEQLLSGEKCDVASVDSLAGSSAVGAPSAVQPSMAVQQPCVLEPRMGGLPVQVTLAAAALIETPLAAAVAAAVVAVQTVQSPKSAMAGPVTEGLPVQVTLAVPTLAEAPVAAAAVVAVVAVEKNVVVAAATVAALATPLNPDLTKPFTAAAAAAALHVNAAAALTCGAAAAAVVAATPLNSGLKSPAAAAAAAAAPIQANILAVVAAVCDSAQGDLQEPPPALATVCIKAAFACPLKPCPPLTCPVSAAVASDCATSDPATSDCATSDYATSDCATVASDSATTTPFKEEQAYAMRMREAVRFAELPHWSDSLRDPSIPVLSPCQQFDLIIAADCLYFPDQEAGLVASLLLRMRKPLGMALIAFQPRNNNYACIVRVADALRAAGLHVLHEAGPWCLHQLTQRHLHGVLGVAGQSQAGFEVHGTAMDQGEVELLTVAWQPLTL